MTAKLKNKNQTSSYAYSRETVPFPEPVLEKAKPPAAKFNLLDNSNLFIEKELSAEEQAIEYMSTYKKFERVIVCNFYTGGGKYTNGILNSIYRGFNPLNP
jgi:hypothetical protein